jgi:hypothetical protein
MRRLSSTPQGNSGIWGLSMGSHCVENTGFVGSQLPTKPSFLKKSHPKMAIHFANRCMPKALLPPKVLGNGKEAGRPEKWAGRAPRYPRALNGSGTRHLVDHHTLGRAPTSPPHPLVQKSQVHSNISCVTCVMHTYIYTLPTLLWHRV